ncbi:MAG: type I DNA topoisomerase [Deltaproteobacteria bacterium]|nr:type I DNA topoisomerase [Deltaproteobacteria bacterium]
MGNALVVVESPAKAKTIKKYLGKNFSVIASVGHVIDLPTRELGVDVENDFTPKYVIIRGKSKVLKKITDAAKKSDSVFLAPDPDREGEAIAWHIADRIKKATKKNCPTIHRARFNEITKAAIKEAIDNPTELDGNLFEAQQARRVLDRLVGYRISPLLWDKVRRGLSAGRVQSVAVRIVCEREAEVDAFQSKEYWSVVTKLEGSLPPQFEAKLIKIEEKDFDISDEGGATSIVDELRKQNFTLAAIRKSERRRRPSPPFITSKIQQEAARKLGFTAKKTMALAQMLYEGIEIGGEGAVGLITYMRTDSIRVSNLALDMVRDYIKDKYGDKMLPDKPVIYKSKRGAQDAHEAIRPTSMDRSPEVVKEYLERDAYRLYDLIWKRFIASQMKPAVFDQTAFDVMAGRFKLRATGQVMRFPGFISVYMEGVDEEKEKDEEDNPTMPDLKEGEELKLIEIDPHQHFTQPPPRFTEASLVKELEEKGIGRPSTYASIMSTIQDKGYVRKMEKRFHPSELGKLVNDLLVSSFPKILEIGFTAHMERELDEVEEGKVSWLNTLKDFYGPFEKALGEAREKMRDVKRQQVVTDIVCEKCNNNMVIKWGKHGEFLACSTYPECRTTKEFVRDDAGEIQIKKAIETEEICDKCGKAMVVKRGKFGKFLACSGYPDCKNTKSISTGVKCPQCADGELVQKSTKRGKIFFGCNKYPNCDFATWDKPVAEKCPDCGNPILVEKYSKRSGETSIACPKKECSFKKKME